MHELSFVLGTVLLGLVYATAQVAPSSEIGRVTLQVPLLLNGKPATSKDREEVARVVEIKPGQVVQEIMVPPTPKGTVAKVQDVKEIQEAVVHNVGVPNVGVPNVGVSNVDVPNVDIPHVGIPNVGNVHTHSPSVVPNPAVVLGPISVPIVPAIHAKRLTSKQCHQLLLGDKTTTPRSMRSEPPTTAPTCETICTKLEFLPICAYNGICVNEFGNQCLLDNFNCKNRDLEFRQVDEEVCRLSLCARRCSEADLRL